MNSTPVGRSVRIGAGCSFDLYQALRQQVRFGGVQYIVIDYLTEGALAGLVAERMLNDQWGYGRSLIDIELENEMPMMLAKGIKLVTNAGGLNPQACADAVQALAARLGLSPRIAIVTGDDVSKLPLADAVDMLSGGSAPENIVSANAYLGAPAIAAALDAGADIVITGRVVDSALTLGPLLHEFRWSLDDYARLGAGTLIGHIMECGAQPTGGIYTDWRDVDWTDSSFPIAECFEDGTAIITKVPGTGGLVTVGSISEQILYEITDPQRYLMPDVTCDLSHVLVEDVGKDRVRVSGATGHPPTSTYKVCCMKHDGYTATASGTVSGPDAVEKARLTGAALVARINAIAKDLGLVNVTRSTVEVIGSGDSNGPRGANADVREAVFRVVIDHPDQKLATLFPRVAAVAGVSMAPGTGALLGSSVNPRLRLFSYLLPKSKTTPLLTIDGVTITVEVPTGGGLTKGASDNLYSELDTSAPRRAGAGHQRPRRAGAGSVG